jgi:hypothetical protein
VATRPRRRRSLAVAFFLTTAGGLVWAARHFGLHGDDAPLLVAVGLGGVVGAVAIAWPTFAAAGPPVERREPDEPPVETIVMEGGGSPFRAHARRVVLAASPRVSGAATAAIVGASLAGSAVLLPASVRLPRWVEAEMVLGAWWAIVAVTLVVLLYRGFRLKDDWVYFAPWDAPPPHSEKAGAAKRAKAPPVAGKRSGVGPFDLVPDGCEGCVDVGDAEGCLAVLAVALVLAIAFGAAWIFAEFALPLVFVSTYTLLHRAIARVANDRHGCEGHLAKSLAWGALWAAVYVAPLAAFTWALHRLVPALR